MALIKCSECGQIISDKATSCPKCGNPINVAPTGGYQQPNDKKSNTLNIYNIKSTDNNTNIANKNYVNNQAHKSITSINI